MAPEQIRGQTVDRRADVWALGVLLWELVTRRHLFLRDNEAETMFAVVEDRVPPPREVEPSVPAQLEAVILKALMRDPDSRYPTAAAMERDLRAWLSTCGVPMWPQWVAETLRMLFPDGPERQRELLRAARRVTQDRAATGASAPSPSQLPPAPSVPGAIDVEVALPEDLGVAGTPSGEEASATEIDSHSRTPILGGTALLQRPAPLRSVGIALAAVCLFALGGAVSWVVLRNSMAEEQAAATEAQAPATSSTARDGTPAEPPVAEPAAETSEEGDRAEAEAKDVVSAEDDATEDGTPDGQAGDEPETAAVAEGVEATQDEAESPAGDEATASRAARRPRMDRAQRARAAQRAPENGASSSASDSPFRRFDTPTASGRLNVTFSGGWAEVFVDGRARGHTPVSLELPAGAHRVRVVPQDGPPRRAVVRVRAGETERVVLR